MIIFVSDLFVEDYVGGGELTSEAIIQGSLIPVHKVHSRSITLKHMQQHADKFWVFGNFSALGEECVLYAAKHLNYSVLEYDYKLCKYRSPEKHIAAEGACDCHTQRVGKVTSIFFKKAKALWFMSEAQKQLYCDHYPFLDNENTRVLSSVLSDETIEYVESLKTDKKNDKWIILNSQSWIKGRDLAVKYAEKNDLNYELVWGIGHKELLQKLAVSRGLIYIPPGRDTCPRLTIEAKLLGCELILNDNVQHRHEAWFQTRESILKYLKSRTKVFWSTVESVWNLETPRASQGEENKFNFIVPFYNAGQWLKRCITSVKAQSYSNYMCYLIDDLSNDNSVEVIKNQIKGDNRFKLIKNTKKRYALGNIVNTLQTENIADEDINIILDGDDWVSSFNVLSHLNSVYKDTGCLMTYGSYVYYPNGRKGVEPSSYPQSVIDNNEFRKDAWRASHLRTFKTKLWNHINLDDLKDDDGDYYKTAYDQALMLPLLEMAGSKSHYISDILHVYNRENPLNVDKVKQQLQYQTAQKIRAKKPYERVF